MNTITITGTVAVWLPSYHRPTDILAALESSRPQRVLDMLTFYGPPDQKTFSDFPRMGEADITMRLIPRDEQTRMAVEVLSKKLEKLRAAYLTAQQEIYEQITNLQALTNEVEA